MTKGKEKSVRVNEEIRVPLVRVITDEGDQLGVLKIEEALDKATEMGRDLVEVSPTADPPVCRIMDYGKFKYQQAKKRQEAKKRQTVILIKEVKLRPKTEAHDVETKLKHVMRFLDEGNKVKISVVFRGREITHPELGLSVLRDIVVRIGDTAIIEVEPRLEGRAMTMMVAPKAEKSA
ncbi:MAG: translation initiation factor IF-3 [Myxococcales bacterium]|nr:MAG: translation initiation factor IF-3 [Myxococcales bacterium]